MSQQSIQAFCNRLKKNEKQLGKWSRKNGITALRVFDRDIPEVPLRVERYGDEVVVWIYDSSKQTPQFIDALLGGLHQTLQPSRLQAWRPWLSAHSGTSASHHQRVPLSSLAPAPAHLPSEKQSPVRQPRPP